MYVPPGYVDDHNIGPVITDDLHGTLSIDNYQPLLPHVDDATPLCDSDRAERQHFDVRSELLFRKWNTFHQCKSLDEIKLLLETMSVEDHLTLVELHAAYANYDVDVHSSFGEAKASRIVEVSRVSKSIKTRFRPHGTLQLCDLRH